MLIDSGPVASVDLSALAHNLSIVRKHAPNSDVISVIKADAYGHGVMHVARALQDSDMFAVARIDEGLSLRRFFPEKPILVLEGCNRLSDFQLASEQHLQLAIHHLSQIDMLEKAQVKDLSLNFWLKVDTGMHRLGIDYQQAVKAYQRLDQLTCKAGAVNLMTHFANADDRLDELTHLQIERLNVLAKVCGARASLANSAGILAWPDSHSNWVRPGIMLYGASPMLNETAEEFELKPAMTLSTQLISVQTLKAGDCIGYGSTWCCPEDMQVGIAAVGYGDGYPRHAPSGTPLLVNGQRSQLVGRVSMDMIAIDLRGIKAGIGDRVVLWGEGLPVEEVAEAAGTISYELFCGINNRVTYEYH